MESLENSRRPENNVQKNQTGSATAEGKRTSAKRNGKKGRTGSKNKAMLDPSTDEAEGSAADLIRRAE